jgi:D-erythro-7,8-dihydroneopterin triphosphate epimerase
MRIRIKNLTLKTIVGVNAWERRESQEVVINVDMEFDGAAAARSDSLADAVDYKKIKQRILAEVEGSSFHLLEALAQRILDLVMENPALSAATVEVDKPMALRFADSVSVVCSAERRSGTPDRSPGTAG